MKKIIAIQVAGTLSQTSKMPCKSFGLPISTCNVGGKLRNVEGSVCNNGYCNKGFYTLFPTVATAQNNRLSLLQQALENPESARLWLDAMITLIGKDEFFRFHDCGDTFSKKYASLIWQLAIELPQVQIWLPTKESSLIRECISEWGCPDNLIIRLSMPMIDQPPTTGHGLLTSTVHRHGEPHGFECTAPSRGGYCADCRACWNRDIPNVSYAFH